MVLFVEIRLFHGITRKAFRRPMLGRSWCCGCCGKVYSGGRLPPCPISVILPWEESNRVLSEAKTKASVQSFCFILKLGPGSHATCCSCRTYMATCSWARECLNEWHECRLRWGEGKWGERDREGAPPGLYPGAY